MLQAIRSNVTSWIVKILFAMLVVSFAIWGIGDIFRGGGYESAVGDVGGRPITEMALSREFNREMRRLSPMFGGNMDVQQARRLGVLEQSLQLLVNNALYDIKADDAGIGVGDETIAESIRNNASFRNSLGSFDRGVFEAVIRQSGFDEATFVQLMRGDLTRGQLVSAVTVGAAPPDVLIDTLARYRGEKRLARTLFIPADDFQDIEPPAEDDLVAFHRENESRYMAPEYRAVTAVSMEPEDLAKDIPISDERVREEYDARLADYEVPERRRVQHILTSDEETAKKAHAAVSGGKDFFAVGAEIAGLDEQTMEIGWMGRDELGALFPELVDAAFSVEQNAVSAPVQSPVGWHVLRVPELEAGFTRTFNDVRDELRDALALDIAVDQLNDIIGDVEDTLGGGGTLEDAAETLNLPLVKTAAMDANGETPDGTRAPRRLYPAALREVIFELGAGEESPLTDTPTDGYIVIRVDGVTPTAVRPLADIRDQVDRDVRAERRMAAAKAEAESLTQRLADGATLAELAAERGAEVASPPAVTRDGTGADANLPRPLIAALFGLKEGGTTSAAANIDGRAGHIVARLEAIEEVGGGNSDGAEVRGQIGPRLADDILAQFRNGLAVRTDVSINMDAIDRLFPRQ